MSRERGMTMTGVAMAVALGAVSVAASIDLTPAEVIVPAKPMSRREWKTLRKESKRARRNAKRKGES